MRESINPKIGDYVLVTKYSDHDPHDPWYIGTLFKISIYKNFMTYTIWEDEKKREYQNCFRITAEEGESWITKYGNGRT
jgi:hypothetical protein